MVSSSNHVDKMDYYSGISLDSIMKNEKKKQQITTTWKSVK